MFFRLTRVVAAMISFLNKDVRAGVNRRISRCRDVGRHKLLRVVIALGCACCCVHVNGTRRAHHSERSYIFRNAPAWLTRGRSTSGGAMQHSWIIPKLRKGLRPRTFHGALARVRERYVKSYSILISWVARSYEYPKTKTPNGKARLLLQRNTTLLRRAISLCNGI